MAYLSFSGTLKIIMSNGKRIQKIIQIPEIDYSKITKRKKAYF